MQFSTITTVLFTVLATGATARNCLYGIKYCGYNLVKISTYPFLLPLSSPCPPLSSPSPSFLHPIPKVQHLTTPKSNCQPTINRALNGAHITPDRDQGKNLLFMCTGAGLVNLLQVCPKGCNDGGRGGNNYCV
ncbi:hypothetical protein B0J14DRAFT_87323 [Halenospora varia]|nr:hypothetical protein B0J14DRAFT_87323 [Halenospora varia]